MNAPKENAPATYDAAREMLARDLVDALVPPECERHATEYLPIADRLLSLGWCRREAVLREAAKATCSGCATDVPLDGDRHIYHDLRWPCASAAILSLLTPQARKEGCDHQWRDLYQHPDDGIRTAIGKRCAICGLTEPKP